jgi:putative tricarboxylic transport membrane protein
MEMSALLQFDVLLPWLLAMIFGIFVGSTPGLTATMAVALIIPITYHMPTEAAIAMVIGVSFTAIFAGDIPATYLRIPGTPASAAATLDGHQLALQGKGRGALLVNLFCSSLGGLIGVLILIFSAPLLARFALAFSFFETFWLCILGLTLGIVVSSDRLNAAIMATLLGILFSTVGSDIVSNEPRYTLGYDALFPGIQFIPAMIGLFGVSEVLRNIQAGDHLSQFSPVADRQRGSWRSLIAIIRHPWTVIQSALTGTVIGALPGAGADVAAWGAYGLARKTSRKPEEFGRGSIEGVIAPTSANNAAVGSAWIPALVFGIPGDAVTAIVLGAFTLYNIPIGQKLFEGPDAQAPVIFTIALVTQLLLIPAGLCGIYAFGYVMKVPRRILMVAVLVFSVIGAYALFNQMLDIMVMLGFGALGFVFERHRIPLPPLILGIILGKTIEKSLRAGLVSFSGDITPMFTRPICTALVITLVLVIVVPAVRRLRAVRA